MRTMVPLMHRRHAECIQHWDADRVGKDLAVASKEILVMAGGSGHGGGGSNAA